MKRAIAALRHGAILAALAPVACWPAHAQDTTGNVQERVQPPAELPSLPIPVPELLLTGRDDLVVLQRTQLFQLHADAGMQFTSNAGLTNSNPVSDHVLVTDVGARASTQIDQQITVFATFDIQSARYSVNPGFDFDALIGAVGTEIPAGTFLVDLTYTGSDITAREFGRTLLTQNDINATLRRPFVINATLAIVPALSLSRDFTEPEDFGDVTFRGTVTIVDALAADLSFDLQSGIYWRDYNDFFQSQTGIHRTDVGGEITPSLSWTPRHYLTVTGSLDLAVNRSSLPTSSYNALTLAPLVSAHFAF